MELCKIQWSNHPVLGDFSIDLTNGHGAPYKTIVLAGENGTGKTSILSSIYGFMNKQPLEFINYIEYSVDGHRFRAMPNPDPERTRFGHYLRINLSDRSIKEINYGADFTPVENEKDPFEFRNYGHIYSSARSGFRTELIRSSTTSHLDSDKAGDDEDYDYTEIKQLLIDLYTQDCYEWYELSREAESRNTHARRSEFELKSRIRRFSEAFDNFFGGYLTYGGVQDDSTKGKIVWFNRNGTPVNIDSLSTGEKQIVFRGAYCLRNIKQLDGGVILVDEPELSMHPKWQKKILDFYRSLFTIDNRQMSQLIIATHSQYVISNALMDTDNVKVIILSNNGNSTKSETVKQFALSPSVSSEVNYAAFGVASEDYLLALYCYIQGCKGCKHIKDADSFIDECISSDSLRRADSYNGTQYRTLPTYIRNAVCHSDSNRKYSEHDLQSSIECLRSICFKSKSSE